MGYVCQGEGFIYFERNYYNANLDVDECLDRTHTCQQICINLPGTFACTCEKGFSTDANEIDCTDNDECALRSHNCHVNAGKNLISADTITHTLV